jgi:hypothetical protein
LSGVSAGIANTAFGNFQASAVGKGKNPVYAGVLKNK